MTDSTSNPLVEIRAAYKALANDPPNSITTMRALKALGSAIEEIQKLQIECMRRGAEVGRSAVETSDDSGTLRLMEQKLAAIIVRDEERGLTTTGLESARREIDWAARRERSAVEPTPPQMWYCSNCKSGNRVDFHHTSCPACGKLRPAEKPSEVYTQEALDAAHARTRERLSKLKIDPAPENGTRDQEQT